MGMLRPPRVVLYLSILTLTDVADRRGVRRLLESHATSSTDSKAALRRLMLDDGSRRSVKVVAGRGFEPLTFRL